MSAAVATWILSWAEVRNELRRRCKSAGRHSEWCDQSRLLRVLPFSHAYGWNVQNYYNARRGTNLPFSPLDWLRLGIWGDAGIPERSIIRGIGEVFDKRDRAPEPHQINSLEYCSEVVLWECRMMKEASVGGEDDRGIGFHFPDQRPANHHTLLLALPPGRPIFQALQSERQVDAVAELFGVGIVFTVAPDEYKKHLARERFGVELEFIDAPCNGPEPTETRRHRDEIAKHG